MSNEARVGIFIVAVVIVFFILSIKIGELGFSKNRTYPLTMIFSSVEGLKKGSTVELAGVVVGSVTDIHLNNDYSAVVSVSLNESIHLPINSIASIATKGVLGDKIVVLTPGISDNTIEPGGNLARTKIPPSVDDLLMQLGELSKNLVELSSSLNNVFGDEDTLKSILYNINDLSRNASGMISENRENVSIVMERLTDITDNASLIFQNLSITSQDLGEIVGTINSGEGTMGKLVYDEALYHTIVEMMNSLHGLTERMQGDSTIGLLLSDDTLYYNLLSVTEDIKYVTGEVAAGRGTLGHIITDDEIYLDLKETISNANLAAQGLEEQMPITVMGTILGLIW